MRDATSCFLRAAALACCIAGLAGTPLVAQATDSDGDTLPDSMECPDGAQPDSDGDGLADCYDDDDGDGIATAWEVAPDEDGDGMPDLDDTDGDGIADHQDADDDGDGVPTIDEGWMGDDDGDGIADHLDADHTDGPFGDPDGDGLTNAEEAAVGSDPLSADSDHDTVFDGDELDGDKSRDTDGDGTPDHLDADDDGDGLPTAVEHDPGAYGAVDPANPPLGGAAWDDVDGDGVPNHLDTDSDGDGKSDHEEVFGEGAPGGITLERSGIEKQVAFVQAFGIHRVVGTRWAFSDNDGDEIPDWLDTYDEDGPEGDPDEDGLTNQREENRGTNPYDPDTDGDGRTDGEERGDTDGDGIPDRVDPDDDNDGMLSAVEGWWDADGDGVPNSLDYEDGFSPCTPGELEIPDGENVWGGWCTDRDCDGIADNQESTQQVYAGGGVHFFSVNPDTGNWSLWWGEGGHVYMPALFDGPCAFRDYDCDGVPNYVDPDWTDGPGENYTGDPICDAIPWNW